MVDEIFLAILAIGVAYLLGSLPSAYLIGRWLKGIDLRDGGDGRMGAALVRRRVGMLASILVSIMDVGKGAAAVFLAQALGLPLPVAVTAGLAAVVGHNWSLFLHFKGGKGALATYGVLVYLMFWPLLTAMAVAGIALIFTNNKTGFSTGVMFGFLALLNLFTGSPLVLVVTPLLISVPMIVKHISMSKAQVVVMEGMEGQKEGKSLG